MLSPKMSPSDDHITDIDPDPTDPARGDTSALRRAIRRWISAALDGVGHARNPPACHARRLDDAPVLGDIDRRARAGKPKRASVPLSSFHEPAVADLSARIAASLLAVAAHCALVAENRCLLLDRTR
jgi:hypothetical protein